jgi:hypothetical protein
MTQEDKDLLLKDLCARLPYGIKVNNEIQGDFKIYGICENFVFGRNEVCHIDFDIEKIKPYLFPMSSMTREQKIMICALQDMGPSYYHRIIDHYNEWHLDYRGFIEKGLANDATGLGIY